jgi:hypothetical protein
MLSGYLGEFGLFVHAGFVTVGPMARNGVSTVGGRALSVTSGLLPGHRHNRRAIPMDQPVVSRIRPWQV